VSDFDDGEKTRNSQNQSRKTGGFGAFYIMIDVMDVEFPRKNNNTVATQALSDTSMTRIFVKNASLPRGMSTPSEIKDRSWSTDSLRKALRKKLEIQGERSLQGSE
jgi:hypothetical protein